MLTGQILLELVVILVVVQLFGYLCRHIGQQWVIGEILAGCADSGYADEHAKLLTCFCACEVPMSVAILLLQCAAVFLPAEEAECDPPCPRSLLNLSYVDALSDVVSIKQHRRRSTNGIGAQR